MFTEALYTIAAAAKSLQSCPTLRPHRWQPTRLHHPWDFPGKNTGVCCHFLLQCRKVKVKSLSKCPTLCDPIDCSYQLLNAKLTVGYQLVCAPWCVRG